MNLSLTINLGSNQETHGSINYYVSLSISLDDGLETRGVFLDISKAFDKVWHEDLLFKLSPIFIIRESQELF